MSWTQARRAPGLTWKGGGPPSRAQEPRRVSVLRAKGDGGEG